MKELSIEEKAKAYTELINRLEDVKDAIKKQNYGIAMDVLCKPYPEFQITTQSALQKSEDERIKDCIGICLTDADEQRFKDFNTTLKDCLDWLHNQGEQNPAEKVEPKFNAGNWVVIDGEVLHVKEVTEDGYLTDEGGHIPFRCEKEAMLWTIQDAKDGDVLAVEPIEGYSSPFVAIFKKQNEEDFDSYCFIGFDGKFYKGENGHSTENVYPATKEQFDTLMKVMNNAGYEWDAEKKELKKIEQKPVNKPKFKVGDKIYLKPEYRMPDDDTPIANTVFEIRAIDDKHYKFDGSYIFIEDQDKYELVEQKPEENEGNIGGISANSAWSEEDEQYLLVCKNALAKYQKTDKWDASIIFHWLENKLSSLRPRPHWKPSDEQMITLEYYIHTLVCNNYKETLFSLYHDLLKLKG